ncbi:MAG: hypothetical protein PHE29_13655 [Tissierellia bacterium]|nr:hypothetical protein [Tissierellia bacterium]
MSLYGALTDGTDYKLEHCSFSPDGSHTFIDKKEVIIEDRKFIYSYCKYCREESVSWIILNN